MKFLFLGDVFGRPGRRIISKLLPNMILEHNIEFVVANVENIRHGSGVREDLLDEMRAAGVDFFTSGNHIFKNKDIVPFLDNERLKLLRPANYPSNVPGKGYMITQTKLLKNVLVINLMGRIFMKEHLNCPFRTADAILEEHKNTDLSAIIVDFHAEATSEKVALAHYLDGRVTAVLGTHTHVPTADERILTNGTAFQSDVGFCGPIDSTIGVDKDISIRQFLDQMPIKHEVASGPSVLNGVVVEVDDKSLKSTSILRVSGYLE